MGNRILVCGPYIGELGFEVSEWLPHIHGKYIHGKFDEVHVFTRKSCMGLYASFTTNVFGFDFPFNERTDSNWMVNPRGPEVAAAEKLTKQVAAHAQNLVRHGHHVECDMLNVSRRKELFNDKIPVRFGVPPHLRRKWTDQLPQGKKVLLAYRAYGRGSRKNTPLDQLNDVVGELKIRGYVPIVVGHTDPNYPIPDVDCTNLVNQTTLADVLALYQLASLIIGCSTGTMHLAAVAGLPFIVWGGGWEIVRERYQVSWNPFKTWLYYISLEWEVSTAEILKGVDEAVSVGVL